MIFDMTDMMIERDTEATDFTDLTTTSGAVKSGPAVWVEDQPGFLEIPFTPEAAESERWPIVRRLVTKDAAEEALYVQAEQAVAANKAWRAGPAQTVAGRAPQIAGDTSFTAAERDTYIRDLATGVNILNNQLVAVTSQNNAIIDLVLRLLNGR